MADALSVLRHDARGCLNAIKLCVTALEVPCTFEENMEFINEVVRASGRLVELMDELEILDDHSTPTAGK